MPMRSEVNGKAADVTKVYCSPDGTAKKVSRIYCSKGGKAALVWVKRGASDNPYRIRSKEDFDRIEEDPGACYVVESDISLSPKILCAQTPFSGVLDGRGHSVSASVSGVNAVTIDGYGHVGGKFAINRGTLKNLAVIGSPGVLNGDTPTAYSGILTGINQGTIERCFVKNITFNGSGCKGVVAGQNHGIIRNCRIEPRMDDCYGFAGGVAALNTNTIEKVYIMPSYPIYISGTFTEPFGAVTFENRGKIDRTYYYVYHELRPGTGGNYPPRPSSPGIYTKGSSSQITNTKELTYSQVANQSASFLGWDFSNIWKTGAFGPALRF